MDQHTTEYIRKALLQEGALYFNAPIELVDLTFTLTFRGDLRSGQERGSMVVEEHDIRKQFHEQLKNLYSSHPYLRSFYMTYLAMRDRPEIADQKKGLPRFFVDAQRGPFTFLPLITRAQVMVCELDILFLRNEKRGRLFKYANNSAGDLDNRIKVLFDALQIPNQDKIESLLK